MEKLIKIQLDKATRAALDKAARKLKCTPERIIRDAIKAALDQWEAQNPEGLMTREQQNAEVKRQRAKARKR